MLWRFAGTSVAWEDKNRDANLKIEWHAPIPYMAAPVPEFELDEVGALLKRELSLTFSQGTRHTANQLVKDICRCAGLEFAPTTILEDESTWGVVSLLDDDRINVTFYLSDKELADLMESIWAFAAAKGPKYFQGQFQSFLLAGDRAVHSIGHYKEEFLRGGRPVVLAGGFPSIGFVVGKPVPAEPGFEGVLKQLKTQFL